MLKLFCLSMLLLLNVQVFSQNQQITGQVIGEDRQPVAGASIKIKGTTSGVISSSNGAFLLDAKQGDVLVTTFIGYQTNQVTVGASNKITIVLSSSLKGLDEVVVTGYAIQKRKDLTGSVAVVNVAEMTKQPSASVNSQLQGQASGVTVIGNGQPGQQPNIRIRGFNSFGNNNPLYVVDGVPTDNINDLNPDDVESLQVLKDAGSASIYGSRASNGVVIVTTKKGKGKVKITYEAYYGSQVPPGGNPFNTLSPTDMMTLQHNAIANTANFNGATPNFADNLYSPTGTTPYTLPDYILPNGAHEGDASVNPALYNVNPNYTNPNDVNSFYRINKANKQGTDWFHSIFKTAPMQKHTITASGGSDQAHYLFGLNFFDQTGVLTGSYLKRFILRANSDYNISKRFRIGENLSFSVTNNPQITDLAEGSTIGYAFREHPLIPVHDIKGNYAGTFGTNLGNSVNPVAVAERGRSQKGLSNRLFGNIYGEADILKSLTFRTSFGGEIYSGDGHNFNFPNYENSENTPTNSYNSYALNGYKWTWTNTLNFHQTWGKHDLKLVAGTEAYNELNKILFASNSGYFSFDPNYVNISTGTGTPTAGSYFGGYSIFSLIGRADYAFADKYLLEATIRRDGSSRFLHYQTGWFPAGSIGWRVSQEDFMKDISWITDLKLRAGYGIMGNQINVSNVNSFYTYGQDKGTSYYDIGGTSTSISPGFHQTQIGNPDAKWEKDKNANFGVDATLFRGHFNFTVEYYKKSVTDLLFNPSLVGAAGNATPPFVNIGKVTNHGIDANATTRFNITPDLKFNATVNITTYKNKINKITDGANYFTADSRRFNGANIVRNQVGQSIGEFYGYKIVGFWNTQDQINAADALAQKAKGDPTAIYQAGEGVGRFRYADVTKQGFVDLNSRTFIGNPNPDFSYGLNLGLDYKGFDFNAQLFGISGNQIFNNVKWFNDFSSGFNGAKSHTALYDSWTPTHMNAKAPISETSQNLSNNQVPNSYFVENGSYLRLKNVQIGYTFPSKWLKTTGISRLRVYVSGANLFTVTKYSGVDPEIGVNSTQSGGSEFGVDEGVYFNPRTYIVGLNLTF